MYMYMKEESKASKLKKATLKLPWTGFEPRFIRLTLGRIGNENSMINRILVDENSTVPE